LTYGLRQPRFSVPVAEKAAREILLEGARAVDLSAKPVSREAAV
jgi:hypothetical protein